ncbi:hypothetical protein AB1Y20_003425 [Prymnesium parvum]|uniref:Uncharacterized protein n=1 Tax=Prymnesium parvum TaxID=97485 RepID=A0AB34JAV8_PRYPA
MRSDQNISFTCISGRRISLPTRAFDIPVGLKPLLSQLSHERREALRLNKDNLTADELTASVANLSFVDVDNSILADASTHPTGLIRVGELNAQRGRYWCEIALQIRETPALAAVDIWLLNEFDLGMARSQQRHTARLLAYALGLNYAWATEFIELSNGNRQEQLKTRGEHNLYGLHGNALLSRWPLTNGTVLRMPGMAKLFHGRPKDGDTAFGYEKRLGLRKLQRFRDNDELRFSMRSFADADGVQNFHVIARGDPPRWLNTSFPRIFWWDETQLLNRLRSQRGISKPLDFQNTPPLARRAKKQDILSGWVGKLLVN